MEIQALIDKRYWLTQQIEELQRQDAELAGEIAHKLLQANQKQGFGSNGIGYAITSKTSYEWGKEAYRYLESKGLSHHFIAPPKITKTKIDALLKDGELTYSDLAEMEKYMTVEQSPYSLRKVVNKELAPFA